MLTVLLIHLQRSIVSLPSQRSRQREFPRIHLRERLPYPLLSKDASTPENAFEAPIVPVIGTSSEQRLGMLSEPE